MDYEQEEEGENAMSSMSNCSEATLYIDEDETRIVEAENSGTSEIRRMSDIIRSAKKLAGNPRTSGNLEIPVTQEMVETGESETPGTSQSSGNSGNPEIQKITYDVATQTDPEPPKDAENLKVLEFLLLRDSQKDLEIQNLKSKLEDLEISLRNRSQLRIEELTVPVLVAPKNATILAAPNFEVEPVEFPAPPAKKVKKLEPKKMKPKKLTEVEKLARWSHWK